MTSAMITTVVLMMVASFVSAEQNESVSALESLAVLSGNASGPLVCACDRIVNRLNDLEQTVDRLTEEPESPRSESYPRDCLEYHRRGFNSSGVYTVTLPLNDVYLMSAFQSPKTVSMEVYCDMTTDGGGWTVFLRRENDLVDFNRNWFDYKVGFGNLRGNFWWGNENLAAALADARLYTLRVDLLDWDDQDRYAKYTHFRVAGSNDNYRLNVAEYSGDAGDSLGDHDDFQFCTHDSSCASPRGRCASTYGGGFWFSRSCYSAMLTAPYRRTATPSNGKNGIEWGGWRGFDYSLKKADMKFRATSPAA